MPVQTTSSAAGCPVSSESVREAAHAAFDEAITFCESCALPFARFELELVVLIAALGRCLIGLFLTCRHERLQVEPFLDDRNYRPGQGDAERTLKTAYGEVPYRRQYLQSRTGGSGFFPLDVVLGLTTDRLTPWVMQWVARLATRMSFKASQMVCKAVLGWAPATETIEQVVLGMGRDAAAFMTQRAAPDEDGEVLVIEVDGKCPPTATADELAKRRGKRRHNAGCSCGCQRHRGQAKRRARGTKNRRKKGDKSKNGKEVSVVVMYTLKHGADGKLHGPVHKTVYATFAGRKAAALWARAEATKRGFGPDTPKTIQIVLDGAKSLKDHMHAQFPKAIVTLDVCHVVERLWALGRVYYHEGSAALAACVDDWKALVYSGNVTALVARLNGLLRIVPKNGPGTKRRRQMLTSTIGYLEPRVAMMQYGRWLAQDLVIATGQVEGTVRQLVGERFDCAGMRWIQGKAEALLHLRCIELNGDWDTFTTWFQRQTRHRLKKQKRLKVLSNQPLTLTAPDEKPC